MNLNQVRILEACHKFLIGITPFEKELQSDTLVYRYRGDNITFDTYQEYSNLSFVDYNVKHGYLNEERIYLDNREDLIDAFPSEGCLKSLYNISDENQVRIQIFKLLSQVNIEALSKKYTDVKKDNLGYDFYNFITKEKYPVYLFEDSDRFELVSVN